MTFALVKLHQILNPTLDSVSVDLEFRKVRDYERAYREGLKRLAGMLKMLSNLTGVFSITFSS